MPTILITGANRGIGLEHVRQALVAGERVIAACRVPDAATDLIALQSRHGAGALRIEQLEIGSGDSIDALAARLTGLPVDVLVNNAGLFGTAAWPEGARQQTIDGMDYALWEHILRVNLLGAFRITAVLLPNILAGDRKQIVMMSSDLGSITNNTAGQSHAYRSSKAALNMITRGLAIELQGKGVTVISLAPGWTQTDLGGAGATWPVADSVAAQRAVLADLKIERSGSFINLTGETLPW